MIKPQNIPFELAGVDIFALCQNLFTQEGAIESVSALDINPDDIKAILRYAKHLLMTERFETAEDWFALLCTLAPLEIDNKLKLAYCQFQQKKYQQALMNYYQVSLLDMTNVEASYQSACCLEALGKLPDALNAYKASLSFILLADNKKNAQLSKSISEKIHKLSIELRLS